MPTAYVLINSDLGTDVSITTKIKEILAGRNDVQYEIQGVYGVYDIILKLSSTSSDVLRSIITNKIRKINNIFKYKYRVVWSKNEILNEATKITNPIVNEVLKKIKIKDKIEIHFQADLPKNSGVGSSSSFCVALVQALLKYKKKIELRFKYGQYLLLLNLLKIL